MDIIVKQLWLISLYQ